MLNLNERILKKSWITLFIFMSLHFVVAAVPNPMKLANSAFDRLNQAIFHNHTNSDQQLQLLVWLKGQNQDQLDALLHNLYTPGNPQYHKFF